ncbi:MAG: hypothetical protein K2W96_07350 [Gemmataceae bacterium]|nr:hypothetical protein [Gemmataceae bacterium]
MLPQQGYASSPSTASVFIREDVPGLALRANDPWASPGGSDPGSFQATRASNLSTGFTAHYQVGGSAVPGSDYQALSGTVPFAPGQASAFIPCCPWPTARRAAAPCSSF